MIGLLLLRAAHGAPVLAADSFRPAPGSPDALLAPPVATAPGFQATADMGWSRGALVWQAEDGSRINVLQDAIGLTVAAWQGTERGGGVGLTAPMYVHLSGDLMAPGPGLGDLGLTGRAPLWQGDRVGLAGYVDLTVPMGGADRLVSDGAPTAAGGLIAGLGARTRLRLAAGYRLMPEATLNSLTINDRVTVRASVVTPQRGAWSASAELNAEASYRQLSAESAPTELLLVGHHRSEAGRLLRLGAGAGLLPGVGAPTWRLTLGIGQASAAP